MARGKLSFEATIARPCEESWAAMPGGPRARHCEACGKQVHNFAMMSAREIEKLVARADGELCARITRRADGSLVTLDARPSVGLAAQVVMSASMVLGAAGAVAQSAGGQGADGQAVLTGTLLNADGSRPLEGAQIVVSSGTEQVANVRSDAEGKFRISVPPSSYDVKIIEGHAQTTLRALLLVEGEQELPVFPIGTTSTITVTADMSGYTTTGGELATVHYSLGYILRHPIVYARHLTHKS